MCGKTCRGMHHDFTGEIRNTDDKFTQHPANHDEKITGAATVGNVQAIAGQFYSSRA